MAESSGYQSTLSPKLVPVRHQLIYYSPTLFEQFGLNFELRLDMGGVLNLVQLVAVGITFFVLDRFGRRFWLLQGSCGMSISHIVIAVLVGKQWNKRFED
jgi:MFS family permease